MSVASLGVVAAAGGGAYLWMQSHAKQEQWAVVQKYCYECHNQDDLAGGRAFDRLSPDQVAADAEIWETAIRKLRGGLMPPAGARRPDGETLDELAAWLASEIDSAADEPPAGRVALRRLNRREYAHAIRDLLALEVDPAALLPEDNVAGYFDNNAEALQVSPSFVTQYIDAARAVALEAVGDPKALPIATLYGDPANMVISLPADGAPGLPRMEPAVPDAVPAAAPATLQPSQQPEPLTVASGSAPPRSLSEQLDVVERRLIQEALARSRFNRIEAADLLGLTLRQLRYRMQRLQINEQE